MSEEILEGGNINSVVRVDDTVRRSMGAQSSTVHSLWQHLCNNGFTACPSFLGIDEKGREKLSYIEGSTEFPGDIWSNDTLLPQVALMLRQYHDATIGFDQSDSVHWGFSYPDALRHEVICHNDFAPYNLIFRDGQAAAVIDFDLAGPGPRVRDVAYAAYWMVPLSIHSADTREYAVADMENGCLRLKKFCASYGIGADHVLLDMVSEVLEHMGSMDIAVELLGSAVAQRLASDGHLAHWQQEALAYQQHRFDLARVLQLDAK